MNPPSAPDGIRLQRVLAQAGLGSRRACEGLIAAGRVQVDGQLVTQQGTRVAPARAVIRVDGERIAAATSLIHLAHHKPPGVLSAMSDDRGRVTVADTITARGARLFHVGRLDQDSAGILLLTNEGELAHRLTHPSYRVPKTYLAEVGGTVTRRTIGQLRAGVELADGVVDVDAIHLVDRATGRSLLEITVHEGRNRMIRRLLETVGHPVLGLVRLAMGSVPLGDLRSGSTRPLNRQEVSSLYRLVDM